MAAIDASVVVYDLTDNDMVKAYQFKVAHPNGLTFIPGTARDGSSQITIGFGDANSCDLLHQLLQGLSVPQG